MTFLNPHSKILEGDLEKSLLLYFYCLNIFYNKKTSGLSTKTGVWSEPISERQSRMDALSVQPTFQARFILEIYYFNNVGVSKSFNISLIFENICEYKSQKGPIQFVDVAVTTKMDATKKTIFASKVKYRYIIALPSASTKQRR